MTSIFAHRGYSEKYPENTMAAFYGALRAEADGIELDVHLTRDGKIAVIHDEKVDRTTYGSGNVCDFSMAELKQLHKGASFLQKDKEEIPSLVEVCEFLKTNDLLLNIELKTTVFEYSGLIEQVVDIIYKYNLLERVSVSSFSEKSLFKLHSVAPDVETAFLYNSKFKRSDKPWEYARSLGATAIHPSMRATSKELIFNAQKFGVAVRTYGVTTKKMMKDLVDAGCTAMIVDDPLLARSVIKN